MLGCALRSLVKRLRWNPKQSIPAFICMFLVHAVAPLRAVPTRTTIERNGVPPAGSGQQATTRAQVNKQRTPGGLRSRSAVRIATPAPKLGTRSASGSEDKSCGPEDCAKDFCGCGSLQGGGGRTPRTHCAPAQSVPLYLHGRTRAKAQPRHPWSAQRGSHVTLVAHHAQRRQSSGLRKCYFDSRVRVRNNTGLRERRVVGERVF